MAYHWRRLAGYAIGLLTTASCTPDATTTYRPPSHAAMAVRASIATADQATQVLVVAFFSTTRSPTLSAGINNPEALSQIAPTVLGGTIVDLTSAATQQAALSVDLGPCLAVTGQAGQCPAYVGVYLLRGSNTFDPQDATLLGLGATNVLDAQLSGPYMLGAGASVTLPQTVALFEVQSVSVTPAHPSVALGKTVQLTANAVNLHNEPITTRPAQWSSSSQSVATVDAAGLVTGVAGGTSVITATVGGKTAVDTVTVIGNLGRIVGEVRDGNTFVLIAAATVQLTGTGIQPMSATTDATGQYALANVPPGTFSATISAAGHQAQISPTITLANVTGGDVVRVDVGLAPITATAGFGSINGKVVGPTGQPVSGAVVSVSGGPQTNGVFRSTNTRADGTYGLPGVVLSDASGAPLTNLSLIVTSGTLDPAFRTIALTANRALSNIDFTLGAATSSQVLFSDTFESVTAWTVTGFWNRNNMVGLHNVAFPTYVSLAPNDASNGALPAPIQGSFAFWYGQPSTGNFLGTQVTGDLPKSGGTSVSPNTGDLVSPVFTLAATANLLLSFDTWFEIESVEPNQNGFDIMEVFLRDAGTNQEVLVRRLNPFVDPTLASRDAIPFTSAGFNIAPIWRPDLTVFPTPSALIGRSVRLVFRFRTIDGQYNGFRGWIVDNVRVASAPASPVSSILELAPAPLAGSTRTRRTP